MENLNSDPVTTEEKGSQKGRASLCQWKLSKKNAAVTIFVNCTITHNQFHSILKSYISETEAAFKIPIFHAAKSTLFILSEKKFWNLGSPSFYFPKIDYHPFWW